jgi:hypothetical protein
MNLRPREKFGIGIVLALGSLFILNIMKCDTFHKGAPLYLGNIIVRQSCLITFYNKITGATPIGTEEKMEKLNKQVQEKQNKSHP